MSSECYPLDYAKYTYTMVVVMNDISTASMSSLYIDITIGGVSGGIAI